MLISITPGGLDDLQSQAFKDFALEFADAITPGGLLSNHGGGLQDDGQGYPNGAYGYIYLFEVAATQFQLSDPATASYFKWAAREIWRNYDPAVDFSQFHFAVVFPWLEELKQLNASGGVPIPLPADDDDLAAGMASKVVLKNEYGDSFHGRNSSEGSQQGYHRVAKKLVVCASRSREASAVAKSGGGYVQTDIYPVPPAWHGDAMQAGTLTHYEAGETLFIYGGAHTKHTSQSDADTGIPTLMPLSDAAERLYPWRYGQQNMKPGSWQRQESPVKWMSGQQNLGSWNEFWQVNMSELGLVCTSTQSQPFHLDLDSVALIGPGGVKVLDDFGYWSTTPGAWGDGTSWSEDTAPDADVVSTPPGGRRSLRLLCKPNATTTANRPAGVRPWLNFTFDGSVYTHLRYHFKLSTAFIVNTTWGWDVASGEAHDDYGASTYLDIGVPFQLKPLFKPFGGENSPGPTNDYIPQFDSLVADADAANGHAHGAYRATGFGGFTADTEWTRAMVLVGGAGAGTLVVADSLVPRGLGSGSDWLVGTPWQLNFDSNCSGSDNLTSCRLASLQGTDWFDLSGFERTTSWHQRLKHTEPPELSLVVKLVGGAGTTAGRSLGYMAPPHTGFDAHPPGKGHPAPWWTWPWQTLWNRQRVREGDRGLFVSVFVPYDRKQAAGADISAKLAVAIAASNESATVTLGHARKRVHLDVHGGWSVDDLAA